MLQPQKPCHALMTLLLRFILPAFCLAPWLSQSDIQEATAPQSVCCNASGEQSAQAPWLTGSTSGAADCRDVPCSVFGVMEFQIFEARHAGPHSGDCLQ